MNTIDTNTTKSESENGHSKLGVAALATALGLTALGFFPRSTEAPAPVSAPESYTDKAQDSAQQSYDPSKDELVIDGIRIKPHNSELNSPSEAVLGSKDVQSFMAANPDEAASIEASSMALPTNEAGEYVVVNRDIDADGDKDAVAVAK